MALTGGYRICTSIVALGAALVAGCAATVAPPPEQSPRIGAGTTLEDLERACPDAREWTPDGKHAVWWQAFRRSREALVAEIARRAEDLKTGPIGSRARELASLRLALTAHDLIEADARAREALERAISLDARNGYAWLWLAYTTVGPEAREMTKKAERTLPSDPGVRCELAAFQWNLDQEKCAGGRP